MCHALTLVSALEYESGVLRSIHSSGELIRVHYIDRALSRWVLWTGELSYSRKSQDLVPVGQHDLWIMALNKPNLEDMCLD